MRKKTTKWILGLLLLFLVGMAFAAFLGKTDTLNLTINPIDPATLADGVYTGAYRCYRWSNTVEVTVQGQRITSIRPIKIPDGREELTQDLISRIVQNQRIDVDGVTGATASTKAFLKAVETALTDSLKNQ